MSTLSAYVEMHKKGHFPGHSTEKNSEIIKGLIEKYGAKTLLDYGCGKGAQYTELKLHEAWGVPMPRLYDPAVPGLDKPIGGFESFDGVICNDVLEHLEGEELRAAIFNATLRAVKFCFFSIAMFPAKKTLPDGRNAHVTLQSRDWWTGVLMATRYPYSQATVHVRFDWKDRHEDTSSHMSEGA